MKLSLMFYLCKAKASPKTGKLPVYLRVTLNRQKAESRLNIEVKAEDIKKWNGSIMRFEDRTMSANVLLTTIDKKFDDFRHHNATELSRYTAKSICDIITGQDSKPDHKLLLFIDKYYQTAIEQNAQMAEGTKRNYRKAFNHLKEFINFHKSKDIMLKDVNISFIKNNDLVKKLEEIGLTRLQTKWFISLNDIDAEFVNIMKQGIKVDKPLIAHKSWLR